MEGWVDGNPTVSQWLQARYAHEQTRAEYSYYLRTICKALKVKPPEFLAFDKGHPSPLFKRTKQYLIAESSQSVRKADLIRFSLQSYIRFHSNKPQKFTLAVDLNHLPQKYSRPNWGLRELSLLLRHVHRKYEPLLRLGAYCGFGRKELVYLNQHYQEVKPVPKVPEAVMLENMPPRKSRNKKKWIAILPAQEFEEYRKNAPVTTFTGKHFGKHEGKSQRLVSEADISQNVKNALKRAEIRITGTNSHVLRSIFKSVGLSQPEPNVSEDYLDMNMGHADVQNYDRRIKDVEQRARAMMPLWEFMRHGPAVATSAELQTRDARIEVLEKKLERLTAILYGKAEPLPRLEPLNEIGDLLPPEPSKKK